MQENKYIDKLIKKALREPLSLREKAYLNQWYLEQEPKELKIYDHKSRRREQIKADIYRGIERSIKPRTQLYSKTQNHFAHIKWAVAASLILFMAFAWGFKEYWNSGNNPFEDQDTFEVFENPAGIKKEIKLPDGSIIHLSHNSTLQAYSDFNQKRLIKLEGEAFFEVARNEALPFTIQTSGLETVVLGTSFNISARKGQPESVAVKTGKVKVTSQNNKRETHFLEKDQQLQLLGDSPLVREILDPESVFGWSEGKLVFRNTSMKEMVRKLENWYGVSIQAQGISQSKTCEITGVYQNLSLEDVLEAIRYSLPIQYKINHKKVKIEFEDC